MEGRKCLLYFLHAIKWVLVIPIYFLVLIGFILIPVLSFPVYIYRYCIKTCAKWFRPDLAKLLASGNAIMVSYDQVYGRNDNTTVIAFTVSGNLLDIDLVRLAVTEKLINAKSSDGTLKYPELQQFPSKWMGFYFWKAEPNFDIKRHVDYYSAPEEGKFYSDVDAANVEAELVTRSHIKQNSPWQIIILPNVKSTPESLPRSIVYFRTHHGLMDGFAIFQLIAGDLAGVDIQKLLGMNPSKWNWKKKVAEFFGHFIFFVRLPYDLAIYSIVPSIGSQFNDFRKDYKDLSREQISTKTLQVPLDYLKEIRKVHNVSFGSVITAAWLGGLRRAMLDRNMKIPVNMQFGYPLPMPGHPGKLRVHASAASLTFPIGEKDPVKRLVKIDTYLKQVKRSAASIGIFKLRYIIGSLFPFMIDAMIPHVPPTGSMNIFAGTEEPFSLFGQEVVIVHFSYGQQKFRNSVLFSSLTFCGIVYIKTAVNNNIFSQNSEVDTMNQFILEELDFLSKHGVV